MKVPRHTILDYIEGCLTRPSGLDKSAAHHRMWKVLIVYFVKTEKQASRYLNLQMLRVTETGVSTLGG